MDSSLGLPRRITGDMVVTVGHSEESHWVDTSYELIADYPFERNSYEVTNLV